MLVIMSSYISVYQYQYQGDSRLQSGHLDYMSYAVTDAMKITLQNANRHNNLPKSFFSV